MLDPLPYVAYGVSFTMWLLLLMFPMSVWFYSELSILCRFCLSLLVLFILFIYI